MAESARSGLPPSLPGQAVNRDGELAALRAAGAERSDPVGLRFIEALARRARQHDGAVRRILDGRLSEALAACRRRLERTRDEARQTIARTTGRHPGAAEELQRLFAAGDFAGLGRFVARLESDRRRSSLAELARCGGRVSPEEADGGPTPERGSGCELRSLRHFRNSWAQRSADKQVSQAIERAPENAGPLNSHMLVLRTLASIRDLSPDYLNRLVSHVDTLLRLEQAGRKSRSTARKPLPARVAGK
ncbi:MAG TPA: DUF2894 domain-containing protein [Candidatus Accumulibacter sp.]|nr:DUF2894 domain-containing protein [Accumulibacter sp.]